MGGRSIACLNARDRNLLGFRRDLLTAAAYGVDQFLLVYGDAPVAGARTGELTVQAMLDELRTFASRPETAGRAFRAGVTTRLQPIPSWKQRADFLVVQVGFDIDEILRWRQGINFDGPVYAGVMVLASAAMATKINAQLTEVRIPPRLVDRIDADPGAGVKFACEQVLAIREAHAFDGVHLIPVSRYREVAATLESQLAREPSMRTHRRSSVRQSRACRHVVAHTEPIGARAERTEREAFDGSARSQQQSSRPDAPG